MMVFVGSTIGSSLGWWAGSRFGIMTAFAASVVGLAAGIYFDRLVKPEGLGMHGEILQPSAGKVRLACATSVGKRET